MNAPLRPVAVADPADVAARIAATVREEIRALAAYPVAKAEGLIKLDAMENPYGLTGAAPRAESRPRSPTRRSTDIRTAAATQSRPRCDARLRCPTRPDWSWATDRTNCCRLLTTLIARPGAVVLAPDPSFVMYRLFALYANVRFVGVPLRADFTLDIDAMLETIASAEAGAGVARLSEQPDRQPVFRVRRRADHPRGAGGRRRGRGVLRVSPTARSCRACSSFPT